MKNKLSDSFKFFLFLVCPDDSTEKHPGLNKEYLLKAHHVAEYIGTIKAVFWIIASVLIAMALAQLN